MSDLATFVAYYAVPCVVMFFVYRQRNLKFPPVFYVLLGMVFLSCGTVHLIEAGIFWWPVYRLSALAKMVTAPCPASGSLCWRRFCPTRWN